MFPSTAQAWGNATFINSVFAYTGMLIAALPPILQSGNSSLGLLPTPILPSFLGASGDSGPYPWGTMTANNTNYYEVTPNTGVTRRYDLTIHRASLAPDGYKTSFILINGQFPGPTLEANWGDMFEITVHNKITGPEEGTTLHWHGLRQKNTPYYDGVPSVTQCPIAPGESFTYQFQADLYGTGWYHSHYSAQYAGGLFGPMVIYGPNNYPAEAGKVIDLGPITVGDLYHENYYDLVKMGSGNNPVTAQFATSRNVIINGRGITDCTLLEKLGNCTPYAGLSKFSFTPGKTHRLRFVNTSGQGYMVISLDQHKMTVIARDYVPIKPYTTDTIFLYVGQRADVLVTANQKPDAYWLRVRMPPLCTLASQPFGRAVFYYDGVEKTTKPDSSPNPGYLNLNLINCTDEPLPSTVPYYPITPPSPDMTQKFHINFSVNKTLNTLYDVNGSSFRANYNFPLLNLTYSGNTSYPNDPQWNVYDFGKSKSQRLIFKNLTPFAHPMHVHGQNMYVLDAGPGDWDGKTVVNPQNPMRRDTATLQPSGYLVVQLVADNPGVWPFHCHIAWHVSQGLYINIMQQPALVNNSQIPVVTKQTCDAWNKWRQAHAVQEIDSGVKARAPRI